MAVSSVNKQGQRSGFANYGPWVDIAAPGTNIGSTYPRNQYATASGTSMSTPFVSGQAALIGRVNTALNPAEVEATIHRSARPLAATTPPTPLGCGHADVGRSLTRLQQGACP